jgi:hypothetical protein
MGRRTHRLFKAKEQPARGIHVHQFGREPPTTRAPIDARQGPGAGIGQL